MKYLKKFLQPFFLATAILVFTGTGIAQEKQDEENKKQLIERLVNDKNFVFVAQSANPMGGRNIILTSIYDVRVSGDTIHSQLPYFGRAFVAPIYPTQSPLQFTTTEFEYKLEEKKDGGYEITMIPKDNRDIRQLFLHVSDEGHAWLQVFSNNRQPISFNGYISESA